MEDIDANRNARWLLALLLLLTILLITTGCEKKEPTASSSPALQGAEAGLAARGWAYAFELPTVAAGTYSLRAQRGKVVLVHFWATWCAPCLEELPALNKIYEKYREHGLDIAAVSVDEESDRKKVEQLVKSLKLTMPVVLAGVSDLPDQYAVEVYPTSLFVGKDGRLLQLPDPAKQGTVGYRLADPRPWNSPEYERLIESLLQASQ